MSELIVIFAACALGMLVAVPQAIALQGRTSGQREIDRLSGAMERAGADFLWQEMRQLGLLLALIAIAVSVPVLIWQSARPLGITTLTTSALALGAGAIVGGASARLAHWAAARATAASLAALRGAPDTLEASAFRGAAVSALVVDVSSTLLVLGAFLTHYGHRAWRLRLSHAVDSSDLFLEATRSLPAAALGASCAGAIFQMGGSSYFTSAAIAAASARTREHVARDEEQNPALVAELAGNSVGGVVSRSADVFSGLVLANCALLVIAALVVRSNLALGRGALGLLCLPLLVRALGSCASAVTASSLRFQAGLSARQLFLGAGASHALMLLAGSFGAAFWLIGAGLTTAFLACGALGILAGMLIRALLLVEAQLLPGRVRGGWASEASRLGALGLGLRRTCWPLVVLGTCLAGAYTIGAHTPIARGGVLGLLLAIATLLGPSALYLGESCFSAISENVQRIVGLRRAGFEQSARSRSEELGQLGLLFGHWGYTQSVLGGAAAALLTAVMLPSIPLASPLDGAIAMGHPIVILGGLTGAASLLFHLGSALQIGGRAVSVAHEDVGERLECEETLERAEPAVLPSYRRSIQLTATAATQSLLRLSALALLAPVLFGVVLRLVLGAGRRTARCTRPDGVCLDRGAHRLFGSLRGRRCGARAGRLTAESARERSRANAPSELRPGVHGTEHRLFRSDRSEGGGDRVTRDRAAPVLKTLKEPLTSQVSRVVLHCRCSVHPL